MFVMSFTNLNTNVILYIIMIGVTGVAESFRAVSITTMAQTCLDPQDLGIGTSLVNFINTLSGLAAASIFGIAYDLKTKADPTDVGNILAGANSVYLIAAIVSLIGLAIVIFCTRDIFQKNEN